MSGATPKQLTVATAATGNGTAFPVSPDLPNKWVEISGTFVGTYNVKAIGQGGGVTSMGTQTTTGWIEVPVPCVSIRVDCDAYTSGQGVAYLHVGPRPG